ncbi:hypothetical protein PGB90_009796 [Kerria lacca]
MGLLRTSMLLGSNWIVLEERRRGTGQPGSGFGVVPVAGQLSRVLLPYLGTRARARGSGSESRSSLGLNNSRGHCGTPIAGGSSGRWSDQPVGHRGSRSLIRGMVLADPAEGSSWQQTGTWCKVEWTAAGETKWSLRALKSRGHSPRGLKMVDLVCFPLLREGGSVPGFGMAEDLGKSKKDKNTQMDEVYDTSHVFLGVGDDASISVDIATVHMAYMWGDNKTSGTLRAFPFIP